MRENLLMLRYQFGWTYRDLATLFGLPVGEVQRLLSTREAEAYYRRTILEGTNGYRKPSLVGEVGHV